MKSKKKKLVLTGGGTAGHVTPNLAIAQSLLDEGYELRYIGQTNGMERDLVARSGIPFSGISAGKLRRYFDWRNLTDVLRILMGFISSLLLIATIRPSCIFSKGGFVACPVVWAGWILRVPVVIHESDIIPGLANRLSAPFARKICYAFPETRNHIPTRKAVWAGLPVREGILHGSAEEGMRVSGLTREKPCVLVIGGSQGAVALNNALTEIQKELLQGFHVIHITGKGNPTAIDNNGYFQLEYAQDEQPHLFALADMIVSRAGATTLFEILALAKPSILIPIPLSASRGDQIRNAASFKENGYSEVIPQEELTGERLLSEIRNVHDSRDKYIGSIRNSQVKDGRTGVIETIRTVCGRPALRPEEARA